MVPRSGCYVFCSLDQDEYSPFLPLPASYSLWSSYSLLDSLIGCWSSTYTFSLLRNRACSVPVGNSFHCRECSWLLGSRLWIWSCLYLQMDRQFQIPSLWCQNKRYPLFLDLGQSCIWPDSSCSTSEYSASLHFPTLESVGLCNESHLDPWEESGKLFSQIHSHQNHAISLFVCLTGSNCVIMMFRWQRNISWLHSLQAISLVLYAHDPCIISIMRGISIPYLICYGEQRSLWLLYLF